jgi:8-oxo-dGTP pyrophosphatase MutT (NUDIX family)
MERMTAPLREAATVVLMRDRPGAAPEVLLVQRSQGKDAFAGGAFVFPGGILERQDHTPEAVALCTGLRPEDAARILGTSDDSERALGYFVAAIRETFEEVGILLARDRGGSPWRPPHDETLGAARAALRDRRLDFVRWLTERELRLAVEDLSYFAHWITPQALPKRFDTRFFLAAVDAAAVAEPDHAEVVGCRWISPADALAAHRAGDLRMVNATEKTLEMLVDFPGVAEARERLTSRKITAIRPKTVPHGAGFRVVNPWEPGYDEL